MGFLFQNCSGGGSGSGTGNGGGSASGPPPEISVNAFAGQTADELTITDDPDDWGSLEVSGKCDSKEHGQEVTVIAQGDEENRIEKKTRCNNPPDGSEADSDSHWRVTLDRDDLDDLQGKNMKALFTASVQSKKGVTGTSQPQALFVEPDIQPRYDLGSRYAILLEDAFEIKGVCRLVVVGNINQSGLGVFSYIWLIYPNTTMARFLTNNGPLTFTPLSEASYDSISRPPEPFNREEAFTNTLTVTIPRNSTEPKRYGVGEAAAFAFTENAYSHCKATTP